MLQFHHDRQGDSTETFTSGKVTSAKILESNSPTLALTYTGVVSATGSFNLGGAGPKPGARQRRSPQARATSCSRW